MGQHLEEQELDDLFSEDVNANLQSPVHPPYSPLPITAQKESECVKLIFAFKLIGDNVDKDVKPRHMRISHQTKSLHYFNVLAVQDRVPTFHLSEECMTIPSLKVTDFMPTADDYATLKHHWRKYPDLLADSCKRSSVNRMAAGSRLSWCIMDFFSCLQLFKRTVLA